MSTDVAHPPGLFGEIFDVGPVLADSVKAGAEGILVTHDPPGVYPCTFKRMDSKGLIVAIRGTLVLPVGATGCVTFYHTGHAALFLTVVREQVRGVGVRLDRPIVIIKEQRTSMRLAIPQDAGLRARVSADQRSWAPRVCDLSMGGVRLGFSEGDIPAWRVGTLVRMDLQLGMDASVSVIAVVARRSGLEFGMSFDVPGHRDTTWQGSLHRLIKLLEQRTS